MAFGKAAHQVGGPLEIGQVSISVRASTGDYDIDIDGVVFASGHDHLCKCRAGRGHETLADDDEKARAAGPELEPAGFEKVVMQLAEITILGSRQFERPHAHHRTVETPRALARAFGQ